MRTVLPSALLLAALVTDARTAALYLVLAAIVACAGAALAWYGELVDGSADPDTGALQVGLATLALLLCVVAASARAQGGDALGVTAVVGALLLLGTQLVVLAAARLTRDGLLATIGLR